MRSLTGKAAILGMAALVHLGCAEERSTKESGGMGTRHVVFIGASVGKDWKLESLPLRSGRQQYSIESVAAYQFDKSEAVEEVLLRPRRRFRLTRTYLKGFFRPAPRVPDIVVLKECAAYFPGAERDYQARFAGWVRRFEERGIGVVVATVVPVTRGRDAGKEGQIEAIGSFNAWLRSFAAERRLQLADLAGTLADGSAEGFLRESFTSGDGLHLNRVAYDLLDPVLLSALDAVPAPVR